MDTLMRSNMCPPPRWLRPQPGPIDGSFSVDTEDGGRFFQENRRFPTNRVHSSGSVGCRTGCHRFVRNGVVSNLCPVSVLRSNLCPRPRWLLPQIDLLSTRTFYRFTYFSIQGSGRSPKSCFVTLRRCSTISRTTALRCLSTTLSSLDPASCLVPDG